MCTWVTCSCCLAERGTWYGSATTRLPLGSLSPRRPDSTRTVAPANCDPGCRVPPAGLIAKRLFEYDLSLIHI